MIGLLLTLAQSADAAAPPGLVLLKGGLTTIGSTPGEIEALVLAREDLKDAVAGETPQHTVDVPAFFLMPTEVTNEQYQAFVDATHARPPRSWGVAAVLAGQAAFLEAQGRAKQEAKAHGKTFEAQVFDPVAWWEQHWHEVRWEIPEDAATSPVVFVSYADARRYARWAGLRLMTEFEFQRAGRGSTDRAYPWGNDWDEKKCQSLHTGMDAPSAVGAHPGGAPNGIQDLAGNVWEWTSSPFTPYPGYRELRFTNKNHVLECLAPFDPEQRVTVSGSFQTDKAGVRLTTRRNTDQQQSTSALGFRCAASPAAGLDAARAIVEELGPSVLGPGLQGSLHGSAVELVPEQAFALRRWSSSAGRADVPRCNVPGYRVITAYQQLLGCPVASVHPAVRTEFDALTAKEGPLLIGFLDLPLATLQPKLAAGTYLIAWRAAGKPTEPGEVKQGMRLEQSSHASALGELPGFTDLKDCYVFSRTDGTPVAAMEAPPLSTEKRRAGSVRLEPIAAGDPKTRRADEPALDIVRFSFFVASASSPGRGFGFDVALGVAPGSYPSDWQ